MTFTFSTVAKMTTDIHAWDLYLNIAGNVFTIISASLAIIIYLASREKIGKAINLLLNYSLQTSLIDLRLMIERLNQLTTRDLEQKEEIINILHDIEGHIKGNESLNVQLISILANIKSYTKNPDSLTEPRKRSFITELRGRISTIDISTKS